MENEQNEYYNGYTYRYYVNSVFFSPNRNICMCLLNDPGSVHGSTMADYVIHDEMERVWNDTGGKVLVGF